MISHERITALIDERIQELQKELYVVDMTISSSNVIRVELDKVDGYVAVEDCMSVSRNIEHNLDREEADFELHVSSAGLDKPFRHDNQYLKNIGKRVKVKLIDASKFEGELISFDPEEIQLMDRMKKKVEGRKKKEWVEEIYKIKMKEIKETKIVISFK
jgi:ribosome maturation factor RimP